MTGLNHQLRRRLNIQAHSAQSRALPLDCSHRPQQSLFLMRACLSKVPYCPEASLCLKDRLTLIPRPHTLVMSGHRRLGSRDVLESGQGTKRELTETPIAASAPSVPPLQRPLPYDQSPKGRKQSPLPSSHGSPQRAAKMPIPRLKRNIDDPSAAGSTNGENNKHRVTHACEPCRQRKTKCSGERPVCKHCEDFNISCTYEDGKRDRTRK